MNCLKTKNIQRKSRGRSEDFSLLITTNLISVPATKTAIRLLTGHPSGRITKSATPTTTRSVNEIVKMAVLLLKQAELISKTYRSVHSKERSMVTQKAISTIS